MATTNDHAPLNRLRRRPPTMAALGGMFALGLVAAVSPAAGATPTPEAGADRRVDLDVPTFSDPTTITNPLFPITAVEQAVQLGVEGDVALRHEITLLDETRVIRWNGQDIETVVSQFVAYGDGEILEVATDFFAQADDGAVWYLGEDVTNYEDGRIADHDGTWLAGRDGPAGMIMPADPQVGDVYRPENIPGFVFEEVTVMETGLTVDGPTGPVPGAILVQERLMDGTLEDKVFAPGYGEFQASVPVADELVTVAVAVPTDAIDGDQPVAIDRLADDARGLFGQAATRNRARLSALAADAHAAWAVISTGAVPSLLAEQVETALAAVDEAVGSRSPAEIRGAAIDLELATLDIELQYDDVADVDEDRVDVWGLQLRVHQAAGDGAGAASDRVIVDAIEDRLPG